MNRHKEEEKAEIQMYQSVEKQFGLYIKQGECCEVSCAFLEIANVFVLNRPLDFD